MTDVVIVGAGMSGLTAARQLIEAGKAVRVIDKGRGVGGRLATRRLGRPGLDAEARLDHGAQFFTTRSDAFVSFIADAVAAGSVHEWCRGFSTNDGYPRYRGVEGMTSLAKWMAEGIDVELGVTVADLADIPAPTYVLAMPIPQSLAICSMSKRLPPPQLQRDLARVEYHSVIALLAAFDGPLSFPDNEDSGGLQQPDHPVVTFAADNQRKGISSLPALTLHASHQWSDEHWSHSDADIVSGLLAAVPQITNGAVPTVSQVQRWRYAGPVTPWPEPTVTWGAGSKEDPQIILAGDAFASSKVEGAFLSGRAAAAAVLG